MAEKVIEAIALCRVSSVEQLQNNSLSNQDEKVRRLAEEYGAEIVKVWSGSVSSKRGKNIKRKDLTEMFDFCDRNKRIKYLFVSEPDRFMRSGDEGIWAEVEFRKRGVEIIFSDPKLNEGDRNSRVNRFMKYNDAESSNEERIGKAIDGHQKALREGRYTFQPPIGYTRGEIAGIHKIDPITGPILRQALISIAEGTATIKQAMDWYNENCPIIRDGRHTKMRMDKWTKFISNPYYAGIVEMQKQIKVRNEKGLHEPLITLEQHRRILDTLEHKKKLHKGPVKGGNTRFPLNKILLCEECLTKGCKVFKFTGYDNSNGKTEKVYSRYFCRNCHRSLTRDDAHRQVIRLFGRLELTEAGRKEVIIALNNIWNKEEEVEKTRIRLYKQRLTELEEKKRGLMDEILGTANQSIKETFNSYLEKTLDEIEELKSKISSAQKSLESGRSKFLAFALDYIDYMGEHFFELPLEEVEVCKKILFPSGFWVDLNKNVYTPEISPLYRERTTKMGPLNPEKCPVVGCEGLEPPTFSV